MPHAPFLVIIFLPTVRLVFFMARTRSFFSELADIHRKNQKTRISKLLHFFEVTYLVGKLFWILSHQILLVENSMFKRQTPFKDESLKVSFGPKWLILAHPASKNFSNKLLVETAMGLKKRRVTRYWEHVVVDLPDQVSWLENSS